MRDDLRLQVIAETDLSTSCLERLNRGDVVRNAENGISNDTRHGLGPYPYCPPGMHSGLLSRPVQSDDLSHYGLTGVIMLRESKMPEDAVLFR